MIPLIQTKLHNPPESKGNCLATCYASIFELNIEDVPQFEEIDFDHLEESLDNWLFKFGIQRCVIDADSDFFPKGLCIGSGPTIRSQDVFHATIYKNKKMIHDPHPSKAGLTCVKFWTVFIPIDPIILVTHLGSSRRSSLQ